MPPNVCDILKQYKTIAVVGLSPKPARDSHQVATFLKKNGFHIIPVNPGQKEILGETCYPSLIEIPEPVEIVDVFRRSEAIPEIAEQAMQIKARVFWMQIGIQHQEAAERMMQSGIEVIMNQCIKVEYMRCGLFVEEEV